MAPVKKPDTQKEQVDQLWWTILGNNGDGLVVIVKELRSDLHALRKELDQYRIQHQRFHDTRFDTCPTAQWLKKKEQEQEKKEAEEEQKRSEKIDKRLVAYGLIVGVIAAAPSWLDWIGGLI